MAANSYGTDIWLPVIEVDIDRIHRKPNGPAPIFGKTMRRTSIAIDHKSWDAIKKLGGGNFSKGLRMVAGRKK